MRTTDLLGALVQSGMTRSSNDRMRNSLGGGGVLESLAGMFGGASTGRAQGPLAGLGGGASAGGLGGLLGGILGDAGQAVGGNRNLAIGGLGALAGALLGGGKKSMSGAMGGGVMALLGAIAFQALRDRRDQKPRVPPGLLEPQTEEEQRQLEGNSELILKAMINAAKADGRIDEDEVQRILGRLQESGVDDEARQFVLTEMRKPMETEKLTAGVRGQPELAAEMYAASLLAIEVDTPAEKRYLDQLAAGLGLRPEVGQRIREAVGLQLT